MRMLAATSLVALLLVAVPGEAVGPPPKPDPKADLEALARDLSFFQTEEFIGDSIHNQIPHRFSAAYQKAVRPLLKRSYPVSSLLPLLRHPNPRVRTLAAAGLFAYEDPRLLHHLVPLLRDRAKSFPELDDPPNMFLRPDLMPPRKRQHVRDVARRFLEVYLQAAGYFEGVAPDGGLPEMVDYWARRKDRASCASWFAVRLKRASAGWTPPPEERSGRIRAIRREIDRLPKVDRALTFLWLWDHTGGDALIDEKGLLEVCRDLGPDRLIDLLRRKSIGSDPDFSPSGFHHFEPSMRDIILPNAKRLLRPRDADALLACPAIEGNYPWAEWFIAAAIASQISNVSEVWDLH